MDSDDTFPVQSPTPTRFTYSTSALEMLDSVASRMVLPPPDHIPSVAIASHTVHTLLSENVASRQSSDTVTSIAGRGPVHLGNTANISYSAVAHTNPPQSIVRNISAR